MPDNSGLSFKIERTLGGTTQLPSDVLSPEAIARLRAGGKLTAEEFTALRAAAAETGSVSARLFDALLSAEALEVGTMAESKPGRVLDGDSKVLFVEGPTKTIEWHWSDPDSATVPAPATYYEALTGRPDPQREFFVTSRRILNGIVTAIAIGLPLGLVLLGIAVGESAETIFFMGMFGLIVGLMLKKSLPGTPFD